MTRSRYHLLEEPVGDTWRRLFRWLVPRCSDAAVILRAGERLSERGVRARATLEAVALTDRVSSWPGSRLPPRRQEVRLRLPLAATGAALLESLAEGLFDWQYPCLPEDLHLLRPDGSVLLGMTAHDWWAWLELGEDEAADLVKAVRDIGPLAREDGGDLGQTSWPPVPDAIVDPAGILDQDRRRVAPGAA